MTDSGGTIPAPTAELHIVEVLHEEMGVQLQQIATMIGADEGTLHRWLSGTTPSGPRKVYRRHLVALQEVYTELRDAFTSLEAARRWLHESRVPGLAGQTPLM